MNRLIIVLFIFLEIIIVLFVLKDLLIGEIHCRLGLFNLLLIR